MSALWEPVAETPAAAVSVSFAPSGNIAETNVQAAIEEVDAEKQAQLDELYAHQNTAVYIANMLLANQLGAL